MRFGTVFCFTHFYLVSLTPIRHRVVSFSILRLKSLEYHNKGEIFD